MVVVASTIIKTLLITGLLASLAPFLLASHRRVMPKILILSILAYVVETITATYFYIYGGRASWLIVSFDFINIEFALEPLSLIFLNLLSGLWLLSVIYSIYYMRAIRDLHYEKFISFLGISIFAASIIALSRNLFTMFIGYELLTLCTLPLIGYYGLHHPQINTYFRTLTFTATGLFLPLIFLVQYFAGTVQFTLGGVIPLNTPPLLGHLLLFMTIFGIAKTALYPLYRWLPAAMIAPYPVSALLHAVAVVKAGLFCIFKIIIYIFGFDYLQSLVSYFDWPIYLACFTMLFAGYKAVTHDSIKNILAYSTISQLSLVLISAFLFIESSMIAAITQMIAHSLAKIVLFFAAGRFYAATKFSHLSQMKGLGIKLITPTIFFIFASLSLIGIPPFIGYYSKSIIIESVRYHEYGALIKGVIYLASALSAIYLFKIIYYLFSESEEELYIPSIDENSIFNKFHKANNYGMDIAIALCCILMMTFPIINNFLHSLLWSVL